MSVSHFPLKRYGGFLATALLGGALLTATGCLIAVRAPIRTERREQADTAFKRLAELSPEKIARFLDQRMDAQLALTDEQRPRVVAINLDHATQLHLIAASDESVRLKERAMNKENSDHEAELKEVITAEQFARFLAMKEEMRAALKDIVSEK